MRRALFVDGSPALLYDGHDGENKPGGIREIRLMAHDVFISYSSKDKLIADAICARMAAEGSSLPIRTIVSSRLTTEDGSITLPEDVIFSSITLYFLTDSWQPISSQLLLL